MLFIANLTASYAKIGINLLFLTYILLIYGMKKYQLYGMGNALVDIIVPVDDVFLQTHKLDKGHMKLMELSAQQAILSAITQRTNGLSQHVQLPSRQSGGSAANTVVSFSHFGGRSCYACQTGQDELGEFYLQDLQQAGVATHAPYAQIAGTTGTCLVLLTPDGERTMCTSLGISASFSTQAIYTDDLLAAECIYIEGYLLATPVGAAAAKQAQQLANQQRIPVALTLSDTSIVALARAEISQLLSQQVDVLFCNAEEALLYTQTSTVTEAGAILAREVACVAITQGASGVSLWQGDEQWQVPALSVEALDTNGAGDLFAAAFLWKWFQDQQAVLAAHFACYAAARLVQHLGPRLPQATCQDLLEGFVGWSTNLNAL